MFGSGESASNLATALSVTGNSETTYISSDEDIYFFSNCQTIANRMGAVLNSSLHFHPNGDAAGSIGNSTYRWTSGYFSSFVSIGGCALTYDTTQQSLKFIF